MRADASVPGHAPPPPSLPTAGSGWRRMTAELGPEPSDEALFARLAAGDVEAMATLYDRHRGVAYGLALRVTGSVPAAEDVLQEAFLGVWRQASAFDASRGSGRSWLLSIVHHRAIDTIRRRRATDPLPDAELPPPAALVTPDVWPEVAGRLDADAVRRALDAIPAPQREAIELAYWGGLTQAEIAEQSGLPLGTVKGRMRLGLRALAIALGDAGGRGDGPSADRASADRADAGRPEQPAAAQPGSPGGLGSMITTRVRACMALLGCLTTRCLTTRCLRVSVNAR